MLDALGGDLSSPPAGFRLVVGFRGGEGGGKGRLNIGALIEKEFWGRLGDNHNMEPPN